MPSATISMPLRLTPSRGMATRPFPCTATSPRSFSTSGTRAAQLIKRPHRPYQFTQLLTLSDGSTAVHRTTSPLPLYRSTRDTRNTPLWNPSNAKMANVEEDEAGRLRAFRRKFGRGWDAKSAENEESLPIADSPPANLQEATASDGQSIGASQEDAKGKLVKEARPADSEVAAGRVDRDSSASTWGEDEEDNLMDLISAAGLAGEQHKGPVAAPQKAKAAKGKRK